MEKFFMFCLGILFGVLTMGFFGIIGEAESEINAREFEVVKEYCKENDGTHHVIYITDRPVTNDFERPVYIICNNGAQFELPAELHNEYSLFKK